MHKSEPSLAKISPNSLSLGPSFFQWFHLFYEF